jgi:4-amino-4-deoxy-L-arabinose transferase-like glycosyltransferase
MTDISAELKKHSSEKSREKIILFVFMVAALIMSAQLVLRNPHIGQDGLDYLLPLHNFLKGLGYTINGQPMLVMPPGYGILSFVVFFIVSDIELSGMLVSLLSYILIIPTAYYLSKYLWNGSTAILSSFFVMFYPQLLGLSYMTLSDVSFSFFFLLSLALFLKCFCEKSKLLFFIFLGFALGVSYLIRPEGFLISILALSLLVVDAIIALLRSKTSKMEAIKAVIRPVAAIISFLLIIAPYILFLHHHTGQWTFSGKIAVNLRVAEERVIAATSKGEQKQMTVSEHRSDGVKKNLLDYFIAEGRRFFIRVEQNIFLIVLSFLQSMFHYFFLLSILWFLAPFILYRPLFTFKLNSRQKKIAVAFIVFLSPIPVITLFFVESRFLLPYSLLLIMLFSFAVNQFVNALSEAINIRYRSMLIILVASVFIFLSLAATPYKLLASSSIYNTLTSNYSQGVREAGIWFNKNIRLGSDPVIVHPRRGRILLFYASGRASNFNGRFFDIHNRNAGLNEIVDFMSLKNADFLVLDEYYVKNYRSLMTLWDEPNEAYRYKLRPLYIDPGKMFQIFVHSDHPGPDGD